jgi:hypothetical protein
MSNDGVDLMGESGGKYILLLTAKIPRGSP